MKRILCPALIALALTLSQRADADQRPQQVKIEARIIEVSRDDCKQLGVNWAVTDPTHPAVFGVDLPQRYL